MMIEDLTPPPPPPTSADRLPIVPEEHSVPSFGVKAGPTMLQTIILRSTFPGSKQVRFYVDIPFSSRCLSRRMGTSL